MAIRSAGILLYKRADGSTLEVWIAHMGGPFWARKDAQAWSIPKGEYNDAEDPLRAALREFEEEIGEQPPAVPYARLGEFRQSSGKLVTAFAGETDFRPARILSNTFPLEWPQGSGKLQEFPEIDDARWVTAEEARSKLVRGQLPILAALENMLGAAPS
ncbi:MAG TPA: NUDIX domain-containing protein [Glaciibacter sp.]|nr:NUDIX domain-containing protein [Glaciibacter sp.]